MFKPKLPQQEQGFTLVEVLVAILITTVFVAVAMQSMVIAAIFKARAQEFSEATTWIQENLEDVKYKAANFQLTSLTATANANSTSINVASIDDFTNNDKLKVGSDSGTYTITGISGKTVSISPALGTTQPSNTVVAGITRCKNSMLTATASAGSPSIKVAVADSFSSGDTVKVGSDSGTYTITGISGTTVSISPNLGTQQLQSAVVVGTPDLGFADGLRDKITVSNPTDTNYIETTTKNSNHTNKQFTFRRNTTRSNTAPYNVLQVSYDVSTSSGGSSLTSDAASGASSITVDSTANFTVNDRLKVGSAPGIYRISAINGNTLTITPTLGTGQLRDAKVVAIVTDLYAEVIPNAALQCP